MRGTSDEIFYKTSQTRRKRGQKRREDRKRNQRFYKALRIFYEDLCLLFALGLEIWVEFDDLKSFQFIPMLKTFRCKRLRKASYNKKNKIQLLQINIYQWMNKCGDCTKVDELFF